jgi:glycosyltransferase involved in cell wall biosynthesis
MGGIEAHCEELMPRIAEAAPDLAIEVIARKPYASRMPYEFKGVRVTPLFSTRGKNSEAITSTLMGVLYAFARRARLVHIHAVGPALLSPLARLIGMRLVFTHHGADYRRLKWGRVAKTMLRLGEQLGVRSAHATIAVAPSLAKELRSRFPSQAHRIHYVPNGKPAIAAPANGGVLSKFGLAERDYVLSVGRLVPEKAFDVLIAAYQATRTQRTLVIAGGADHESPYSRTLLAQAGDNIVFTGALPREQLQELYANAALFVLASSHEGLPIAALEAGSLGCPMLLSDIQPNRDLGLPARNYFEVGNAEALAAGLRKNVADLAVDSHVFDAFDWDRIAVQTLGIYRAVLEA